MKHLYQREDRYILFDGDSLKIYEIPGEEIENVKKAIESENCEFDDSCNYSEINLLKLDRLVLCVSDLCNLSCKYCYLGHGEGQAVNKTNKIMSKGTLERTIDYVLELFPEGVQCIQFFGGEPLLNFDLLTYAVDYINAIFKEKELEGPKYTIVTNGTLINDEVHSFFNKYFDRISVSLDGRKNINDYYRCTQNSDVSVHDLVYNNIQRINLDRKYRIDVQMTITDKTLEDFVDNPVDFRYIENLNVDNIHISPLIETKNYQLQERETTKHKIQEYFKRSLEISWRKINETNYTKTLSMVSTLRFKRTSDHFCKAGITDITVSANGMIYPCFMFMENDEFIMGSVYSNSTEDFYKKRDEIYLPNKVSCNEGCKDCWAKKICYSGHSGCIGAFYHENRSISKPIGTNCTLTKEVFENVILKIVKYRKHKG